MITQAIKSRIMANHPKGHPMIIEKTIANWHQLLQQNDPQQLKQLLADDVVFHSPVLHTPQKGKALTTMYLSAAFHVLVNPSFSYKKKILQGHNAMLEFETSIDDIHINGVDIIQCNDEGKITDFKVMVRPLKGLQKLQEKMFELLQHSKN